MIKAFGGTGYEAVASVEESQELKNQMAEDERLAQQMQQEIQSGTRRSIFLKQIDLQLKKNFLIVGVSVAGGSWPAVA